MKIKTFENSGTKYGEMLNKEGDLKCKVVRWTDGNISISTSLIKDRGNVFFVIDEKEFLKNLKKIPKQD